MKRLAIHLLAPVRRLFLVSVVMSLLVAAVSIAWAATTVKSTKSNSSDRAAVPGTVPASQKDPCANVKNDPTKQADCQKAAKLGRATLSGGGSEAKVSVCSGGYWWTGGWGGWTQGGPCSPEGAIK